MTTQELLEKALLRATGKYKALTASDSKWQALLMSANILIDAWASEPDANWNSLYDPNYTIGSTGSTDTYDLDDEIDRLSNAEGDFVRVKSKDSDSYTYFTIVLSSQLKLSGGNACAVVGRSLVFNKPFTTSGDTILAPVYLEPDHLVKPSDEVPVDDPNWLVLMVAAEYARGKRTLSNQYPLLLAQAQQAMAGMKSANEPQSASALRGFVARGTEW